MAATFTCPKSGADWVLLNRTFRAVPRFVVVIVKPGFRHTPPKNVHLMRKSQRIESRTFARNLPIHLPQSQVDPRRQPPPQLSPHRYRRNQFENSKGGAQAFK